MIAPHPVTTFHCSIFLGSKLVLLLALLTSMAKVSAADTIDLVKDNKPQAVIILSDHIDDSSLKAVESFVKTVEQSTSARLPILKESERASLAQNIARIYVGETRESAKAGVALSDLPEEGYRILSRDNSIFILGRPGVNRSSSTKPKPTSQPTLWALNSILEQQLGVRWLWPGSLGTYVPKHVLLSVPAGDTVYQPKLMIRSLWLPDAYLKKDATDPTERRLQKESIDWVENHQVGRRGDVKFGHAFGDWWAKYGATHPDYFGETPPGFKQPYPRAERVKLRLSNPAVIEQIAQEYIAAGKPPFWNVCPNDGSYFDVSAETREWDIPKNQSVNDIWKSKANLTARYVKFWNLLYERLHQINPDVILCTYAYSAYKTPPPAERPLTAKMAIALVHSYNDYEAWEAWSKNGSMLFLRPNWWHYGANAPNLPLTEVADFIRFAWGHGMHGIMMDSIIGYWGTLGPSYYLVARLMTRPDLSKDDIVWEYTSAFGDASPQIAEYLRYWEKISLDYNYMSDDGRFKQLMKNGTIGTGITRASRQALPFLYSDEVLRPAYKILEEAQLAVKNAQPEFRQRVQFLKDGLDEMKATRDLVASSEAAKRNPNAQTVEKYERQSAVVEEIRSRLTPDHTIWNYSVSMDEDTRQIYFKPRIKKPTHEETDEI